MYKCTIVINRSSKNELEICVESIEIKVESREFIFVATQIKKYLYQVLPSVEKLKD